MSGSAPFLPMEAKTADALPVGAGWQYEPKWDGFRCIVAIEHDGVALWSKSGKPLQRFFPEVAARFARSPPAVLDGELLIPLGPSLSFDALQARLHPAESRIRKLSAESPALFMAFDCLATEADTGLALRPLSVRRQLLQAYHNLHGAGRFQLSPLTLDADQANSWLKGTGDALDGVIAKRSDEPYRPGQRAMIKVKRLRSADCVVGGFRYASGSKLVGSLLLGLFDDLGLLHHVGFTSAFASLDKAALTAKLERLVEKPGFTGDAPGRQSRWQTERSAEWQPLRPELVVEVRYDQVIGRRFRHGTAFLRWRPDKAPAQCGFDQFITEAAPSVVAAAIGR